MPHIAIISSSVRTGRISSRVATYFKNFIEKNNFGTSEIIDLKDYNFPIFEERLKKLSNPSPALLDYAKKISSANGIIIVTPEYNGGYPASLKNAIDVLYEEWRHKPVAISTVSDGSFGGTQVLTSLQFSLFKIGVLSVPAMFPCPRAQDAFNETGEATDPGATDKRATAFIKEMLWCIKASSEQHL